MGRAQKSPLVPLFPKGDEDFKGSPAGEGVFTEEYQAPDFPQQLPGTHPREEGAEPQQAVSPEPGSLPPVLTPEALEVGDSSLCSSEPPHRSQDTSSSLLSTSFSDTLPQEAHKNSKMGILNFSCRSKWKWDYVSQLLRFQFIRGMQIRWQC